MKNALLNRLVDERQSRRQQLLGVVFVVAANRQFDLFQLGAQPLSVASIHCSTPLALTVSFDCRLMICHELGFSKFRLSILINGSQREKAGRLYRLRPWLSRPILRNPNRLNTFDSSSAVTDVLEPRDVLHRREVLNYEEKRQRQLCCCMHSRALLLPNSEGENVRGCPAEAEMIEPSPA